MTKGSRHSRVPLRRTSAPEKILSAGLATATCIGIAGLVGARSIEATANAGSSSTATEPNSVLVATTTQAATSTPTLTVEQLDAYAAQLSAERKRLDDYRAKLVRTANRLAAKAIRVPAQPSTQRPNRPAAPPKAAPAPRAQAQAAAPQPQSSTKGS